MSALQWMDRFGVDPSMSGDIAERAMGRSRLWVLRQVVAAVAVTALRDVRCHPWKALTLLLVGWASVLLFFSALGNSLANAPGKMIWNWTVEHGYDGLRVWWFGGPMAGHSFLPVSYLGFGLSGWIVGRLGKPTMTLAYATSVFVVLAGIQSVIEYLHRPMIVPHTLFYVLAPSLPFVWRTGLVLLPTTVLLFGLLGHHQSSARKTSVEP